MNQKKRASSGSWEREMAWRLGASARRTELTGVGVTGEGVPRRSSWSSLAIVSGSEGSESLLEKWCTGENETGDRRESIREFRESLEKITEGFAESEEFREVQRCPEMSCMPWLQCWRGTKTGAGHRGDISSMFAHLCNCEGGRGETKDSNMEGLNYS